MEAPPVAELNGKDFRARVRLSTKADVTLAEPGETCERVATASLAGLLAGGHIEPVDRAGTDVGRPEDV